MKRPSRWSLLATACLAIVGSTAGVAVIAPLGRAVGASWEPSTAWAAGEPTLTVRLSAQSVGVGEDFFVELEAQSEDARERPSSPRLVAPPGFEVSAPSISNQTMSRFDLSGATVSANTTATWQLRATKAGNFSFPGPTFQFRGRTIQARPFSISISKDPQRSAPRSSGRGPSPLDPRDPFAGSPFGNDPFFDSLFGRRRSPRALPPDDSAASSAPESSSQLADPALALPKALDPEVFVIMTSDKTSAVIGEQVTVGCKLYSRLPAGSQLTGTKPAVFSDFLVRQLEDASTLTQQPVQTGIAGGLDFDVRSLCKIAAFPLKAGTLSIGGAEISLRLRGRPQVQRSAPPLLLKISEPPRQGRPEGYRMGDVGRFQLAAGVTQATVREGDLVALKLTLSGTGNLPEQILLPQLPAIEWLDPDRKDEVVVEQDRVGGSRTFTYLGRVRSGDGIGSDGRLNLGEARLPYWNPDAKRYEVATAALGSITVASGGVGRATSQLPPVGSSPTDSATSIPLPPFRPTDLDAQTSANTRSRSFLQSVPLDRTSTWALLLIPPGAVLAFFNATKRLRSRRQVQASRAMDASAKAQAAAHSASALQSAGKSDEACLQWTEALACQIEHRFHFNPRGYAGHALQQVLVDHGLTPATARALVSLREDQEALRFAPSNAAALGQAHALCEKAKALFEELRRA